jgi:hypothetical protein
MTIAIEEEVDSVARIPTEIQRQQKVIDGLGDDYVFPLFNGRQAIESQRKSGYKNTSRAAREIIDNSFEAGAKNVWIAFQRAGDSGRVKGEWKDAVTAVAFIDDGPGMIPKMAQYALSWGGGTHFENPTGIGRFGFGLPNSSINQTRKVSVYSRTDPTTEFVRAVLDITPEKLALIPPSGLVKVEEPEENVSLPDFVVQYLKRNKIELGTGTVVVWEKPDRLQAKSASKLKEYMLDDFGVVYRYILDEMKFKLTVDGTVVQVVDPLFLMKNSRFYLPPEKGGAMVTFEKNLTVKHSRDAESGVQHVELLKGAEAIRSAKAEAATNKDVVVGTMSVTIARFPYGMVARRVQQDRAGGSGAAAVKDADAFRRVQIRAKRRGITFVRANREIDTVDLLPTTEKDRANGLGRWPVLQGYALAWGAEVRFSPNLDEIIGIGNDKQTLNPSEDFWRVLCAAEVDKAVREEQKFQQVSRQKEEEKAAEEEATNPDKPNPATDAAAEAESLMGRRRMPDDHTGGDTTGGGGERDPKTHPGTQAGGGAADGATGAEAGTKSETGTPTEPDTATDTSTRGAVGEDAEPADDSSSASTVTYGIGFFESEGGVFYKPALGNQMKRLALINKAHPFFKTFYTELVKIKNPKARQAVDLLLMALAQAELFADLRTKMIYQHQREAEWSPFLKLGLNMLTEMQAGDPEEDEEDVSTD